MQRHQQLLVGVAFLSAGELERAVEEKAHSVNMAVVGNRRVAARLCAELSSGEEAGTLHLRVTLVVGMVSFVVTLSLSLPLQLKRSLLGGW